jgi:hypothetical protein
METLKSYATAVKELIGALMVFIGGLYAAAKGSPMAYIAGCITMVILVILFLLLRKVYNENRRRKGARDGFHTLRR